MSHKHSLTQYLLCTSWVPDAFFKHSGVNSKQDRYARPLCPEGLVGDGHLTAAKSAVRTLGSGEPFLRTLCEAIINQKGEQGLARRRGASRL